MKKFLYAGFGMVLAAIVFISYSLVHPEASWPIRTGITNMIYLLYIIIMVMMFIAAFIKRKKQIK